MSQWGLAKDLSILKRYRQTKNDCNRSISYICQANSQPRTWWQALLTIISGEVTMQTAVSRSAKKLRENHLGDQDVETHAGWTSGWLKRRTSWATRWMPSRVKACFRRSIAKCIQQHGSRRALAPIGYRHDKTHRWLRYPTNIDWLECLDFFECEVVEGEDPAFECRYDSLMKFREVKKKIRSKSWWLAFNHHLAMLCLKEVVVNLWKLNYNNNNNTKNHGAHHDLTQCDEQKLLV